MKKILLLSPVIFLWLNVCVQAQNTTWYKTYDGHGHANDAGYSICKADGDNFFVTGYALNNGYKIYLLKINKFGDTLFTKEIGGLQNQIGLNIATANFNTFYISGDGSKSFLIKINLNGDTIWKKYYGDNDIRIYESKIFSNNQIISCGKYSTSNAYIQKVDTNGNLLWSKIIPSQFFNEYRGIEQSADGNIIIVGNSYNSGIDTGKATITKYNQNGDTIWQKRIINIEPVSIKKIQGGFILGGQNSMIVKIDESANLISLKNFQPSNRIDAINDLKIINSNRYVLCGVSYTHNSPDTTYGKVLLIDSSLNVIKQKLYPSPNNFIELKSCFPDITGDILFTGYVRTDGFTYDNLILARANSELEGPVIGIHSQNTITPENFTLSQNYPNPFNPSTKISYSLKKSSTIELKLFDINGRMIKIIESGFKPAGSHEINFSAEGLSSGVYFFSLYSDGITMDTKKAVILK